MFRRHHSATALAALVAACSSGGDTTPADPGAERPGGGETGPTSVALEDLALDGRGLATLDASVDPVYSEAFALYAPVETGSGRIHVVASHGVTELELLRVRNVLAHGLEPVPGTSEGVTKSDVSAAMVDAGAVLAIFADETAAVVSNSANGAFFDAHGHSAVVLLADAIVVEGTEEYMRAAPAIDGTFGSAARLILKTGLASARPAYAGDLETHAQAAITSGVFTPPAGDPAAAYLALAMDVHAGVFGHDPDGDGTARSGDAALAATTREELALVDPVGCDWIEAFFSPHHDFQVDLPEAFDGTFDCLPRSWNPYSHRAQHLRRVRLTGTSGGEILGAPFDLVLDGDDGNNNLKGRRGYDRIDGGGGFDTAVYSFPYANYEVRFESDGVVIVEDVHGGHEQTDTLTNIERLQFSDRGINL